MKGALFLLILAMFIVACAETTVVKLGEEETTSEETQEETAQEAAESAAEEETGGASVSTEGKVATACDDIDAGLTYDEPGMVVVDYSDGTSEAFYDECAVFGDTVSNFLTEYFCEGDIIKSKNYQCKTACFMIKVQADPTKKVGFCG